MAIAVGGVEERSLSDINVVPLTDVMLVLLIVFLITVPITLQTVEKLRIPVFKAAESKD
jgi:biopolymer transport protein ExbD